MSDADTRDQEDAAPRPSAGRAPKRPSWAYWAIPVAAACFAGCPTVELGEDPVTPAACRPDPGYYRDLIWPEFVAPADAARSCVAEGGCHQRENGRSAFRVSTSEPVDHGGNYNVIIRFLNCGSPEASAALTKPLAGVDAHGGGDLFDAGSSSAQVFLDWFER